MKWSLFISGPLNETIMGFTLYDTNCTHFVGNTVIRVWISFVGCYLISAFLYTEICTQMNKFSKYSITVNLARVFGWQFCPQSTVFNCHIDSCLTGYKVFADTKQKCCFWWCTSCCWGKREQVPYYTLGGFLTFQEWCTKGSSKSQILIMILIASCAN